MRTSATEVSIQAVSPELGVHFSWTLASQAGGAGSAAAGAAAGASVVVAAGACANEVSTVSTLANAARMNPKARAMSPARESLLNVIFILLSVDIGRWALERGSIGFAGADAHRLVDAQHEDLSVADLAGFGRRGDGLDHLVDVVGRDCDFDLQLGQETHGILSAAIDLGVTLLTSVSFDLRDGHPVHADPGQGVADLVELEWLDDGHDDLH